MSDLLALLSNGARGLAAHSGAAATASHNLQNAATPGYTRQSAQLEAVRPPESVGGAYVGRGVELGAVTQSRDRFLEAQLPAVLSSRAQASAESEALQAVAAFDPSGEGGLAQALGAFFDGVRALSQNPGDPGLRRAAVSNAQVLASAFRTTAGALDGARDGLDPQIAQQGAEASRLAAEMADLNRQIGMARAGGASPNDLLDARLRARDRLAELTGARSVEDSDGNLSMFLPSGLALVSGHASARLVTQPDPANRGHVAVFLERTDGRGQVALADDDLGGSLGGALAARDVGFADAEQAVDQLAFDLAGAVNAIHQGGLTADGQPGGELFVVGAAAEGAASRFDVDAAVKGDPGLLAAATQPGAPSGDASNLTLLLGLETTAVSNGKPPADALADATSDFGSHAARAMASFEQAQTLEGQLTKMRESVSGVSIDEELVAMTRAQRAYEAVTRVINTADEMLQTLMQLGS